MNETIYNSSIENGLLKSVGPFKVTSADKSISGVIFPVNFTIASPTIIGSSVVYGVRYLGEEKFYRVKKIEEVKTEKC